MGRLKGVARMAGRAEPGCWADRVALDGLRWVGCGPGGRESLWMGAVGWTEVRMVGLLRRRAGRLLAGWASVSVYGFRWSWLGRTELAAARRLENPASASGGVAVSS